MMIQTLLRSAAVAVVVVVVGEGGELATQLRQEPVLLPDGTSQHPACVVTILETPTTSIKIFTLQTMQKFKKKAQANTFISFVEIKVEDKVEDIVEADL